MNDSSLLNIHFRSFNMVQLYHNHTFVTGRKDVLAGSILPLLNITGHLDSGMNKNI